jgi:hypothetical protein
LQLKVTRKEVKEVVVQEGTAQELKTGLLLEAQTTQEQRLSQEILLILAIRQLHQEEVLIKDKVATSVSLLLIKVEFLVQVITDQLLRCKIQDQDKTVM